MTAYGLAHLRQAGPLHDDVYEYLERIDATLKPFGAKFLVHGGRSRFRRAYGRARSS